MGIVLVLYNLTAIPPKRDERYDVEPDADDKFIAWMRKRNCVYKYIGDLRDLRAYIEVLDIVAAREWVRGDAENEERRMYALEILDWVESKENIARLMSGNIVEHDLRKMAPHTRVYERPKDLGAARTWTCEHIESEWERNRLLDLLDLLESDNDLWLYET